MRRALAVMVLSVVCAGARAEAQTDAPAAIDGLHEALLASMRCNCPLSEREALLAPVLEPLFDVRNIARISSGRAWRDFSEAEQDGLVTVLRQLLIRTYADRFDSFDGQVLEQVGTADARTGPVVKTEIVRSSGERVTVDYYFRGERVFNVVAEGVSDLSLRRAEYSSILKAEGYPALVAHIEASLADLAHQP